MDAYPRVYIKFLAYSSHLQYIKIILILILDPENILVTREAYNEPEITLK
jgi:hypothetical protein